MYPLRRLTGCLIVILGSIISLYAFFWLPYNNFSGQTGKDIAFQGCSALACGQVFHLFWLEPALALITVVAALVQMGRQNDVTAGKGILLLSATSFLILFGLYIYDSQGNCFIEICAAIFYGQGMWVYPAGMGLILGGAYLILRRHGGQRNEN